MPWQGSEHSAHFGSGPYPTYPFSFGNCLVMLRFGFDAEGSPREIPLSALKASALGMTPR
jgi:hypothetical protein